MTAIVKKMKKSGVRSLSRQIELTMSDKHTHKYSKKIYPKSTSKDL